ncbi:MAG TPA: DEAD/DEAH box helicase [Thiobacillus sp.]|nr:MAG: helicase [Hydrogenophilales bacterium 28-61-11]OYZ56939.1 MAG: helicase [Hydrogenophilales bacterium 16-61-112]OZA43490.1 MAG: helicase [Hydrogenophilales bacterium 17-61-76]HQT30633.1 DEAD/DEAH box helicase [Thiobacillus sp.]HQT70007.1 DEAD/DEAH box helicase [Thiobacillus sp.]
MTLPDFTERDVLRWFGADTLKKARPYLHSITRLEAHHGAIRSYVLGTAPKPYRVEIECGLDTAGDVAIEPYCTCPVGRHCKHAAATLLAWLAQVKPPAKLNPEVLNWVEAFRRAEATSARPKKPPVKPEQLFYCLTPQAPWGLRVQFIKARGGNREQLANGDEWLNVERALTNPPSFVNDEDMTILPLLWAMRDKHAYLPSLTLKGDKGETALQRMLASGRLCYDAANPVPLRAGDPRAALLHWQTDAQQHIRAHLGAEPPATRTLCLRQLWYVDGESGEIGVLDSPHSASQIARLLELPPLSALDVPVVATALAELAPALPRLDAAAELRCIDAPPVPHLTLDSLDAFGMRPYRDYPGGYRTSLFDFATLAFRYAEFTVSPNDKSEFVTSKQGEAVRIKRDFKREAACLKQLEQIGFKPVPSRTISYGSKLPSHAFGLASEAQWPTFMAGERLALQNDGWVLHMPADFRHHVLEVDAWEAEFAERGNDWLAFDLGVVLEGQRLPLAPLLHDLFRRDSRWLDAALLDSLPDSEAITLLTPEGARFLAPAGRIKPLARTLIDLFDARPDAELRVSRLDAPRLAELAQQKNWQFKGEDAVIALARQLQHGGGIQAIEPPQGLQLELRPYQREGLAWLQYLREQNLSGILADDMGLGKTAQALAHLLLEKEAGRLDRPALVVLPTSLIFNWKREAERFAPDLRVLSLHGKDRAERFALIAEHDVVLTTYPLLWRDNDTLAKLQWHVLILDEAQTVKNAGSRAAKIVRDIDTRHRLCITGTPMENHLGELWAQFDFLLPGFLGDSKQFARTFRTPVEKHGDAIRAGILSRRVAPFILRRRKEDVAKELPPKTIIVRSAEIVGGQRDLYETVRSAMDAKVLETIAQKGFARSQIVILDALLKLRQVCCDPRLLKSAGAKSVKERAKLDLLMDMLPELLDEGRKVLLFSQFTSMLALIEPELTARKIKYVILTGDTSDRESVIRAFQEGDVPVFLISLKAGGVGLNLTAADTVIHYDPWWNPAVENQATDRAHRIGQTKNVFVYKLVVAGSIEEKILALQEKKAELAASVLTEDHAALAKFGESDIRALLAPLPASEGR